MKLEMLAEAMLNPKNQEMGSVPGTVLQKLIGTRGVVLVGRGGIAQAVVTIRENRSVVMSLPQFWEFVHQTEGTLFSASLFDITAPLKEIEMVMSTVSPDLSKRSEELKRKWRSFLEAWERLYSDVEAERHT